MSFQREIIWRIGWVSGYKSAAGLVNALLRRAAKESDQILADNNAEGSAALAITLSHPQWLIEKWSWVTSA